jgi:hypothetical protein
VAMQEWRQGNKIPEISGNVWAREDARPLVDAASDKRLRKKELRARRACAIRKHIIGRRMIKGLPTPQAGATRLPVRAATDLTAT